MPEAGTLSPGLKVSLLSTVFPGTDSAEALAGVARWVCSFAASCVVATAVAATQAVLMKLRRFNPVAGIAAANSYVFFFMLTSSFCGFAGGISCLRRLTHDDCQAIRNQRYFGGFTLKLAGPSQRLIQGP